jgi:ABC-type sugar transport system permease subunit
MNIPQAARNPMKWQQQTSSPHRAQDYVIIALFLLPAVVLFLIYTIFRSIYYSLFNWNSLGPATKFVRLNNFK